ncbi:MAG: lamin tail domain-containing protein, partial [Candidatus Bathyarchaeia archaeon]
MQEDNSAARASAEFSKALAFLKAGNFAEAAKTAGIMSHYIADMAVFGHVMGSKTDWGEEAHHSDYERYVDDRISRYSSIFDSYLSFDGKLSIVSAYDAALRLAYNTTFGVNGDFTCVWMDLNYNWSDPKFVNRVGQSLNLAVNYISDVLHTLYVEAHSTGATKIVINEVELNPAGVDEGKEWVELYNPTQNAVDLSYWTLSTTAGDTVTITIPPGTILNSG